MQWWNILLKVTFPLLLDLLLDFDRIQAVDFHHQIEPLLFGLHLFSNIVLLLELSVSNGVNFSVQDKLRGIRKTWLIWIEIYIRKSRNIRVGKNLVKAFYLIFFLLTQFIRLFQQIFGFFLRHSVNVAQFFVLFSLGVVLLDQLSSLVYLGLFYYIFY